MDKAEASLSNILISEASADCWPWSHRCILKANRRESEGKCVWHYLHLLAFDKAFILFYLLLIDSKNSNDVCSAASSSSASLFFLSHCDVQLFTDSVTSVVQTRSLLLLWENQSPLQRLHILHIKWRTEERWSRILRNLCSFHRFLQSAQQQRFTVVEKNQV